MDWRSGRVLPELQLLLLTSARGEFETRETGKVAIRNHAVVVVFPGVWHRYRPDRSYGWTERWISLNCWAAKQAIDAGIIRPGCPVFESNNMQEAVELFDAMAHHAQARPNGQHATISQAATKLMQLATDSDDFPFPRQTSTGGGNGEAKWDPIVEEAREIIWNHENLRNVCVSEVAKYLPVTRRTLDRRFASTLGQSVLEEINTCRLWRARAPP